jgi:chromate transporter
MIKRECVDEERWVEEETFKKTLAVYQVLPGPEAHELCVYFGRIRGGKLGGFVAGLGFMLPGFLLMLALSVLYVEADLADQLDELFYGLTAAVGAIVARALVRLSRSFITDLPLALLAAAAFALTVFASASFVLVLLGAGIAYELWTNAPRWTRRAHLFLPGPAAIAAITTGALTLSLTAEIFWEGLKAGLLTFGGAYTVIPYLHDAAVDGQHSLTDGQFVDGLAMSGVLPAPTAARPTPESSLTLRPFFRSTAGFDDFRCPRHVPYGNVALDPDFWGGRISIGRNAHPPPHPTDTSSSGERGSMRTLVRKGS